MCVNQAPQKIDWEPIPLKPDDSSNEIVPPRLFNPKQLAVFSQLSSAITCECPQHLSTIIETLNAFEDYSAKCENATKQDAALHSYLNVMIAKARHLIEEVLHKLAEIEEINIQALN